MKRSTISKTCLSIICLGIVSLSVVNNLSKSTIITHNNKTLKSNILRGPGDKFYIDAGGDWGGTSGSLEFLIVTEPSTNTHGTAILYGPMNWVGDIKGQKSVTVDDKIYDVTSIKYACFLNYENLTTVDFSRLESLSFFTNSFEGSSVTSIDISCPVVGDINDYTFKNCKSLVSANLKGVTTTNISRAAFNYCTLLKDVDLSMMTTGIIRNEAFAACSSLTNINLARFTTGIFESNSFVACSSLKKLDLPMFNGIISGGAFAACSKLEEINLSSMASGTLQSSSFGGDVLLNKIVFGDVDPTGINFQSYWLPTTTAGNINFYVPYNRLPEWEALNIPTLNWGEHVTLVGYVPSISSVVTNNNLLERSPSTTATLTISGEYNPDLSTLKANVGSAGLSVSSFTNGVATIKANKAKAGENHITISCDGCEDLDVIVMVAPASNSYLPIILSFGIGFVFLKGITIFFLIDKRRKDKKNK